MSYLSWFNKHANKHQQIVQKIDESELINYFKWDNISKSDVDFCPLFTKREKCHEMENLNCYLCACPNFRFDDSAKRVKSWCSINSEQGKQIEHNGLIHQDCSGCTIPHHQKYIEDNFDIKWLNIMKKCPSSI